MAPNLLENLSTTTLQAGFLLNLSLKDKSMIFGKSGQTRYKETAEYLNKTGFGELALHIDATIRHHGKTPSKIAEELSLGANATKFGSENKRHALRALLLCQRVYFSDMWAMIKANLHDLYGDPVRCNLLVADWKTRSIRTWSTLSEGQILDGIRVFTAPQGDAAVLADNALRSPLTAFPNFDGTTFQGPMYGEGSPTCYIAMMTWMLYAGLVSYRWYMKHSCSNTKHLLMEAFGKGKVIWEANRPFEERSNLPVVPKGHIVHIYVDDRERWLGHWMISKGDGYSIGCNNGSENETLAGRKFSRECSLNKQFYFDYKALEQGDQRGGGVNPNGRRMPGICEVYNPLEIRARHSG